MQLILTGVIVALIAWAAWQDRPAIVDEWQLLLKELGL